MNWTPLKLNNRPNTSEDVRQAQIVENIKLDLPWFAGQPQHKKRIVAACSGPSLEKQLPKIRQRMKKAELWTVNGTYNELKKRGMVADVVVLLDGQQHIAEFVKDWDKRTTFYVASQCHPDVFKVLEGAKVIVWHAQSESITETLKGIEDKPVAVIEGGAVVGLKLMFIAYLLGYRTIDYYGLDGSITDKQYAFGGKTDGEPLEVMFADKKFKTYAALAQSANEFIMQMSLIPDCTVRSHGEGLIPHMAKTLSQREQTKEQANGY